ncbi:MAG: amidohydrolase [Jannaschia sp.]
MIRCELDGLPIPDDSGTLYRSTISGQGHQCGHDGHMAIVFGVAHHLAERRPARGRTVLLFQPAEEDGSGAAAVLADPAFATIAPDWAFALHNTPGLPLGHVSVAPDPANCASRGLHILLSGRTAHASRPHEGLAPTLAVAELLSALTALGADEDVTDPAFRLVTVTHARLGEPTYGVAPGLAEVRTTLRTLRDEAMQGLVADVAALLAETAARHGLGLATEDADVFVHCDNHPNAARILAAAADDIGVPRGTRGLPMRGSEDFSRFGAQAKSAMFLLGSGDDHPGLHSPDYNFPDDRIPIGLAMFMAVIDAVLED